jgi:signal transduction histidine kinase
MCAARGSSSVPRSDVVRTITFRLTLAVAGAFACCVILLLGFIYWETETYQTERVSGIVRQEAQRLERMPPDELLHTLEVRRASDPHRLTFVSLFASDGSALWGVLQAIPAGLPADGTLRRLNRLTPDDEGRTVLAVARRVPGGRTIVVWRSIATLVELHRVVFRALLLGLVPMVLLAVAAGGLLSMRTVWRLRVLHEAIGRIMRGRLNERLPVGRTGDDLDRLTDAMNRMLEEIERLVGEAKSVGDNIAHDLRTPLARVRTRLERGRRVSETIEELRDTVDSAIADLDVTFGIVTALLRIGEMESGRRRAGFSEIDLAGIAQEVGEIYAPMAEERGLSLTVEAPPSVPISADRDLMIEALANLVGNAIKFTPSGGAVRISVAAGPDGAALRVADTGPGIPDAERDLVLRRFYRADRGRQVPGHGLGLSLVTAIAHLHGFQLIIENGPGCAMTLLCGEGLPGMKPALPPALPSNPISASQV